MKTDSEEDSSSFKSEDRVKNENIKTSMNFFDEDENHEEPVRNVEEIRRRNLEDNKAFLESLLMAQIRDDFKSWTNALQPSIRKETRKKDNKYITVSKGVPVRRSRRLAGMDIDGNKLPSTEESDNELNTTKDSTTTVKRILELSPEEQELLQQTIRTLFEQDNSIHESKKTIDKFSNMNIMDENVLKLTPDRLLSLDIHSRSDILAITGCDRKGTVGLVVKSIDDLNGKWSKMNYDFHTEYATCCRFDNFNFNTIKSTSYDSTFRTCDIVKNVSIELYKDAEQHGLTSFDYQSLQTCLISEDNGDVLLFDTRTNSLLIERFDVSKKRIRTLHINPKETNEFCIAGTDPCVKIWDLRNMSTMKYCLQTDHSCYGAYYNYIGSHIMTTTRNDSLISFSCNEMKHVHDPLNIQPIKRIHHRNFVNRFVTPFTAQPYALFESHFLTGSQNYPREISVYDENCKKLSSLNSENLNSLATVNVSHRLYPIVVGGNSSGRIHVFTGHI